MTKLRSDGYAMSPDYAGADVVLEVTAIGKACHDAGCAIKKAAGTCVMPREGVFAKVLVGGDVTAGDVVAVVDE